MIFGDHNVISNLRNSWPRVMKDKLSWNFYDHKFAWEFLLFISTLFVLSFLLNRLIWYLHQKCTYILSTGREKGENHPVFFQGFTLFSLKCTSQRVVWKNCYYFFFQLLKSLHYTLSLRSSCSILNQRNAHPKYLILLTNYISTIFFILLTDWDNPPIPNAKIEIFFNFAKKIMRDQ